MRSSRGEEIPRRVFTTAVVSTASLGLAGCLKGDGKQVSVYNSRSIPVTANIEIYHVEPNSEQQVLTDDPTIPSGEAHEYTSIFEESGTKRITIKTDDGQHGQHEWSADSSSQRGYLSVRIEEETLDFSLAIG